MILRLIKTSIRIEGQAKLDTQIGEYLALKIVLYGLQLTTIILFYFYSFQRRSNLSPGWTLLRYHTTSLSMVHPSIILVTITKICGRVNLENELIWILGMLKDFLDL